MEEDKCCMCGREYDLGLLYDDEPDGPLVCNLCADELESADEY